MQQNKIVSSEKPVPQEGPSGCLSYRDERINDCLKLLTYDTSVEDPDLLSIVPEEMWRVIFSKLEEPQDVENCFRTCIIWRDILVKERTSFLFEKILPLLTSKNLLDSDNIIHSCRGVSKIWKLSSDKHLRDIHPHSQLSTLDDDHFTTDDYVEDRGDRFQPSFRFISSQDIEEFMEKADNFHNGFNPFLKNGLDLVAITTSDADLRRGTPWNIMLHTFLPKYGVHVFHLRLLIVPFNDAAGFYSSLVTCLRLMPNLHSLRLRFVSLFTPEKVTELQVHLENLPNQFPELRLLKIVKFFRVPFPLVLHILDECESLEKVKLQPYAHHSYLQVLENTKSRNIRELVFVIQDETDIQSLANSGYPLEKLYVYLENTCDLDSFFQALSSFAKTLTKLTISFKYPANRNEDTIQELKLQLPYLKALTIVGYDIVFCPNTIDFILPMVSLQELKVVRRDNGTNMKPMGNQGNQSHFFYDLVESLVNGEGEDLRERNEQEVKDCSKSKTKIQFYDYFEKMYESNVWELMPSLERISVKWKSTRETRVSGRFFYSRENLPRKELKGLAPVVDSVK